MIDRIALTGLSRVGKDEAAKPLIQGGWEQRAFGAIIKDRITRDRAESFCPFRQWLMDGGRSPERIASVAYGWNLIQLCDWNAFTEVTEEKRLLRAVMEEYGLWKYSEIEQHFFESLPVRCVNSRLCRPQEARRWRHEGGVVVEVVRPGAEPQTQTEKLWMEQLRGMSLIDRVLVNNASIAQLTKAATALASSSLADSPPVLYASDF